MFDKRKAREILEEKRTLSAMIVDIRDKELDEALARGDIEGARLARERLRGAHEHEVWVGQREPGEFAREMKEEKVIEDAARWVHRSRD